MVIIATVLVVVLVAVPAALHASAKPSIGFREASTRNNRASCDAVPSNPPQSFVYSFLLLNTGDVDGYATVNFILDGSTAAQARYFVTAHGILGRDYTLTVADCGLHEAGLTIATVDGV